MKKIHKTKSLVNAGYSRSEDRGIIAIDAGKGIP